ncbi:MAG: ABC transporter permease [Pseudomonadota bacterium]
MAHQQEILSDRPAGDLPPASDASSIRIAPPGEARIRSVNWQGLSALYMKEVRRFFKVKLQTIWAPAITTLLFLVIFTVALGREGRMVLGVPFSSFIAPGLIVMAMMQNAFANASFSLLGGKLQGTIIDYLMPPLSVGEVLAALVGGAMTRAILVGATVWLAMFLWPTVTVSLQHPWALLFFGLMGALMLSFMGVMTSIWAEKFDHSAAITNFVVAPLSLLSGTFYVIDNLAPAFQAVSRANPFFYVISGFRYGFIGKSDASLTIGIILLIVVNIALGSLCYMLLRSGWKIKS